MSSAFHHVELSEPVVQDALRSAAREGKSLQEWVNATLEERFRMERVTEEFFRERSSRASGRGLRWALDHAPDVPPMPGDEIEE